MVKTFTYMAVGVALAFGAARVEVALATGQDARKPIPCTTDSDCMRKNGGDGNPAPVVRTGSDAVVPYFTLLYCDGCGRVARKVRRT